MPRKKQPSRVLLEWDAIVFSPEPLPIHEQERRWRGLYDSCRSGDEWTVAVHDATLVTRLGTKVKLWRMDYPAVINLVEEVSKHPDYNQANDVEVASLIHDKGLAQLLHTDFEDAANTLRALLTHHRSLVKAYVMRIFDDVVPVYAHSKVLPEPLRDLARDACLATRCTKKVLHAVESSTNFLELASALRLSR